MLEAVFLALFGVMAAWLFGRRSQLRLRARLELVTVLLALLVAGAYVIAKRFEGGLGAVTNMSDRFPWGIWIGFDLCGVALAAGGFVVAGTVHVFHLRRFTPILRPTVLTSFIAYLLVAAILVLDLGRPQRFWHPLIMWQHHSVMFEITLCLSLYTLVLALEFSPAVFERLGRHRLTAAAQRLALPIVMIGVILSTLHQSSFGSLFLIVPEKLHALWYTPALPVLFLVSAVGAGLAVVIVESVLCAAFLERHLTPALLAELGRILGLVLWVYLALRLGDVWWRRAWAPPAPPWLAASFLAEVIVGVIVPAAWFGRIARTPSSRGLLPASALVIAGVVLNRLNISWLGLLPYTGPVYVPTWMELAVTAALVAVGVMAFLAIARFAPVFPDE